MDNKMLPIEQPLIAIKRNFGRIIKSAFNFPDLGLIISLAFLALGYYLKTKGAQTNMQGDDVNSLSNYIIFGKLSYFCSGVTFLISAVVLIWGSINKKKGSFSKERKSLSDLQELSWNDFREYIISCFEELGYSLVDNRDLNDESTDLKLKKDDRLSVVRCKKYYVRKVPLSMVLEFYIAMSREPALEKGYFITTGFFSSEAKKFASGKQIELIDGVMLMDFVRTAESKDAAGENILLQKINFASKVKSHLQ